MIEQRMAQETAELQLFEGWRAASQGCIRDKFRDTVSNNRLVEERLGLPHTQFQRKSHTSLGFTLTDNIKQTDMQSAMGATQQSAIPNMKESMDDITNADHQVASITGTPINPEQIQGATPSSTPVVDSPTPSPLAREMSPKSMYEKTASDLIEAAASPVPKFCVPLSPSVSTRQDLDDFDNKLLSRQVKTNQRLRSLSLDATKTWTRPASDPLHVPSPQ